MLEDAAATVGDGEAVIVGVAVGRGVDVGVGVGRGVDVGNGVGVGVGGMVGAKLGRAKAHKTIAPVSTTTVSPRTSHAVELRRIS